MYYSDKSGDTQVPLMFIVNVFGMDSDLV